MKRNVLSLKQKKDIIFSIQKGESVTVLAKKFNIAKSTVCAIKKNKNKILDATENCYELLTKKTVRYGEMPKVEEKLYEWFCIQRKKNIPVTTDLLKEKAKAFNIQLKEREHFQASDGWVQKFKRRFGIRFLKITGEKLSCSSQLVAPFKKKFQALISEHNLTNDQIYNADESSLFWRMLTSKTLVQKEEKTAPGRKADKARITFLVCANASGDHKLKPLVIGKAAKPRCFNNFALPVHYKNSKKAWMTAAIFEDWFKYSFIPQVKKYLQHKGLPTKAVLLLDNAPSHPPVEKLRSDDGNIFVVYMPPNVTPLIQPMDQNVIRITKLNYRSSVLSSLIALESDDLGAQLKKLTLKDAVLNLRLAWDKLNPQIIYKCWSNILSTDECYDLEDDIPLSVLRMEYIRDIEAPAIELATLISQMGSEFQCSINDIENLSANEEGISEEDCEESDEETLEPTKPSSSNSEALNAFNIIINWAEENCDIDEILVFRKCRERALQKILNAGKKQSTITEFFSNSNI